jgi:DNA modification methylase
MKGILPESIHLMVTSPPYYNAREYSHWKNLNAYLDDMHLIVREAYRVLDNHRVFVFNVGDIFDNDNITTTSTWGKRRIPLGAYFTKIFEEEGFTFVDDFIWDKGEVQSERHKNGNKPYPFIKINSKGENKLGHAAPFPIEIPEMAIKLFSYPNEIVLDPFGGSFTSVIAAKQLSRIGVGVELNKEMFEKSIRRNLQNKLKSIGNSKIKEFNCERC